MSVSELIHARRAIFPKSYDPTRPVERAVIEQLLENANQAPTHRLTEPWRFVVFHSAESRTALADYMAEAYRSASGAAFSQEKYDKTRENPLRSGAVIALVMQRDPEQRVPEWEELAAVAMAVQNMWLTCAEIGLGCYWSTPQTALDASAFLELKDGQQCIGLFYLGWHNMPPMTGKRGNVAEKTRWR